MRFFLIIFFQSTLSICLLSAQPIAFPGAEGFGKYTKGGRGGIIIKVTNLNDSGPGSLREAVSKKSPRIILFDVDGTIHLTSKLNIQGNVTIAGQSAPGDGICIADQSVQLSGDNIIIRYLRFRLGDKFQRGDMVDGNGSDDALGGNRRKNIIIDHCSLSWSNDEVMSIYGGDSTTLQWNLIAEPLNYSYHFEKGDKDFENHGYGGIWGGKHLSAHHNLFAHCVSRNPRFNGNRFGQDQELVDFRNNVIYNWEHNSIYGGELGNYNVVNNFFKPGPNTKQSVVKRIVNPSKDEKNGLGIYFVNGNWMDGNESVSSNNSLGIEFDNKVNSIERDFAITNKPFSVIDLPHQTAKESYSNVLNFVGASYKRDTLDQRIIKDVILRKGAIIDVQGGFKHGTPFENTLTAWPTLRIGQILEDSDQDGMPDKWEKQIGLNAKMANANGFDLSSEYTNVEVYLNTLVLNK
jgi:pectate lyase